MGRNRRNRTKKRRPQVVLARDEHGDVVYDENCRPRVAGLARRGGAFRRPARSRSSAVTTRKMTEEERVRYGLA